ncbi:hypothetical protein [Candidatus Steffania adelgidicola]|nr:hypothetical protein [Candidatus Steffania adelgidicola]
MPERRASSGEGIICVNRPLEITGNNGDVNVIVDDCIIADLIFNIR